MEQPKFNSFEEAPQETETSNGNGEVRDFQTFEVIKEPVEAPAETPNLDREQVLRETEAGIEKALAEENEIKERAPGVFSAITSFLNDHLKRPESEEDMDEIPPKN